MAINLTGAKRPAIFNISAELPFADTLAAGVMGLAKHDPSRLSTIHILLPTRRACRALREAFLRISHGKPTLLPHMSPIGDVDEDELLLSSDAGTDDVVGANPLEVPPPISNLRRQLLLARMVMAKGETSPDQAVRLAIDLARLLDQLHTEQLDFSKFTTLVPDAYSEHWQKTLTFLEILTQEWPLILESEGTIDPADRRNRLLQNQTQAWRKDPPKGLIIAAGSTGSIPATADLLMAIADLPNGRVVLPGLDQRLPNHAWQELEPHHPQFGLSRLLIFLNVERCDVLNWSERSDNENQRLVLARIALSPASVEMPNLKHISAASFENCLRIDCPTSREEAGVIAIAIRQVLEIPSKTVALITPDRSLARRVASELRRWQIDVNDSAGQPLGMSPAGSFFRVTARMVGDKYAPVALLSALKHPMASGGMERVKFKSLVRKLEQSILRGPRPAPGIKGLRLALEEGEKESDDLIILVNIIEHAARDMDKLLNNPMVNLRDLVRAHIYLVEALAASNLDVGATQIWAGDSGEGLAGFTSELLQHALVMADIGPGTYPALLDGLMSGRAVRSRYGLHPRVFIWGLMEARLQRTDLVILGGLNEGTWPPQVEGSPWMSRPMMTQLGLPQPERQIGLTAHDFVQSFAAPNILMTRSERVDGSPKVASRWLMRLDNILEGAGFDQGLPNDRTYLSWFEALDRPDAVSSVQPPSPKPPVASRPKGLSVTQIETWIRDPYSIFAAQILNLKCLNPLDQDPGASGRGILIHGILEEFIITNQGDLPSDAEGILVSIGNRHFKKHISRPGVRAFWWPRFLRIANWFISYEHERRTDGISVAIVEKTGNMTVKAGSVEFNLRAKVDRVDRMLDGSLSIIDYKTGQPPTARQVETGLVPQLSLEAAMAMDGAFPYLEGASVNDLTYLHLSGGRVPGEVKRLKIDVDAVAANAITGLRKLVGTYSNPNTPYRSRPRPMFKSRFGDYDHLARVREWSSSDEDDGT
jgi:ATP-dependent helicase/nuclease subunit B